MKAKPNETYEAYVTQFLLPNGRQRQMKINLDIQTKALYDDMDLHEFRFEAEVLSTGLVHISVSDAEGDVDAIVVSNGPEIQEGMEQMLRNQRWLKEKRTNVK